jgi:hypothetical protein
VETVRSRATKERRKTVCENRGRFSFGVPGAAMGEKSNFSAANEELTAAIDDDRILRRSYLPGVKSALRVAKDDGDKRRSPEAN